MGIYYAHPPHPPTPPTPEKLLVCLRGRFIGDALFVKQGEKMGQPRCGQCWRTHARIDHCTINRQFGMGEIAGL